MISKQKLVYVTHGIAIGGAEIATLSALSTLRDHYDLRVYVLGKSDAKLLSRIDDRTAECMVCWDFPSYLLPLYLPFVYLALARFRPDVVISSLWRSAVPAVLYRMLNPRTKYFIMLHSTTFFHRLDRFFLTHGIKRSDRVFADSKATARLAAPIVGNKSKIEVVSCLIASAPKQHRERNFDTEFRFFYMGRLNTVKRVHLAVKVIAWLRGQGVDASLHIYGRNDGDEVGIREEIDKHGLHQFVVFCGEILPEQKEQIYSRYNCYIQMSAHEGMAMSVVEAMQQGMLCVLTPVGEIPYYAEDQVSAVFMEEANGQITRESLYKLVGILRDADKCSVIATNAQRVFADKPNFAVSLLQAIQKSQHHA